MIPRVLLDQEAYVEHYGETENEKGDPVWSKTGEHHYPCRLDLGSTTEDEVNRLTVRTTKTLILPAGAIIGPKDTVTVDGLRYKVDGEPDRLRAFGREHHVEAQLRSTREEA